MLSVKLHIAILMVVIVRADETCTKEQDIGHLVQSLQDCANAITGQSSPAIEEYCSPDSLLLKVKDISYALTALMKYIDATISNIEEKIATDEANIAINKENITKNSDEMK